MSYTATCPTCDKPFTKDTEQEANRALSAHHTMKHGNGRSNLRSNGKRNLANPQAEVIATPKRKYTRRTLLVPEGTAISPLKCLCPRCGFDLSPIATLKA